MRARSLLVAAGLAAGAACGGEDPLRPVAGDLTVSYVSAGVTDGAVLVLVTGGPVASVSAEGSYLAASGPAGANATRVVVTGPLLGGDLFKIRVPDVGAAADYSVRVEAVADRHTFALADPAPYTATVRR
jgi:hypothetical protein